MSAAFGWMDAAPVRAVMAALNAKGEARFVGGCVRDSLIGRPPAPLAKGGEAGTTDIDVATTLRPEETIAALKAAGLAAHPTGVEHGTITAVAEGLPVEVTTLRADIATDGRHAEVAFTTDWAQDWRRRDFTINAIYSDADGTLFDPAAGQADLDAGRVRFIGDPDTRIQEDYLRILRFFRFTSRYAAAPDEAGLAACARQAEGMVRLSKERIWQEVARLFATPKAPAMLAAAEEAGVLRQVIGASARIGLFARLHDHLYPDIPEALAVAALWPDAGPGMLREAFKPPRALIGRIEALREARAHLTRERGTPLLRALYRSGREAVCDAMLLEAAEGREAQDWLSLLSEAERLRVPVLPIGGRDLIAAGLAPGPALGEAISRFEAEWLAQGCPADEERISALLERVVRERG